MNIPFSLKRGSSNPPLSAIFLSLLRVKGEENERN